MLLYCNVVVKGCFKIDLEMLHYCNINILENLHQLKAIEQENKTLCKIKTGKTTTTNYTFVINKN